MFTDSDVAGSWPVLLDRLATSRTWGRWVCAEPALARVQCPAGLVAALAPGAEHAGVDALLGALVRLAAADGGDDGDAVLLLLHLLSGGVARLAAKVAHRCEDSLQMVVGELACQIRTFPWQRRTRAYAANLLLDTKHALWVGELRPVGNGSRPDDAILLDAVQWWDLHEHAATAAHRRDDAEPDLVDLLAWAASCGIASEADLTSLLMWEPRHSQDADCGSGVPTSSVVSERTLRRHRRRTLLALQNCRNAYLATVA